MPEDQPSGRLETPILSSSPMGLSENEARPDLRRMRGWRLERVRAELRALDVAGLLLFDPINIRYACGSRNMAVWTLHNAARYLFVATDGPVVLFDFHGCEHLSEGLETIDEVRLARGFYFYASGPHVQPRARAWAAEIAELVTRHGGGNRRLALDHCDPPGAAALAALGIELLEGQGPMEMARRIKSPDELACMAHAMAVCEAGMAAMRDRLEPGVTENQVWAELHRVNAALGGEWIETRLLSSGPRTNPWFQECGKRVIRAGELVSFDTDLIGPFGMCCDVSRSFFCGPGRPSPEQRRLYGIAWEQIHHNLALLRPGVGFRELAERAFPLPESCRPRRYSVVFHGVGLCDEYPHLAYAEDFDAHGYDGVVEPGMTLCVESYVGELGGREGVKLEQQVLVTETDCALLSSFPFEEALLERWV